ncbi:MAG: 16S rRNA (uracil(1498)-N(3))-methyltransferase [Rhizobiaceae bacterium]
MRTNYKLQRLYCDSPLAKNLTIGISAEQAHYLLRVLRMRDGDEVLVFNGRDGEWRSTLRLDGRKKALLNLTKCERPQTQAPDLVFCFAPLKTGRLDYLVQKAVEMGAGTIQPVITHHTQITKFGEKRLRANIIEAAEQCGVLFIPELKKALKFETFLDGWNTKRRLIFCDEACEDNNPIDRLNKTGKAPIGLLIGPEGGFSDQERQRLMASPFATSIPLGPRILRADTAAVAALAVVQATIGDW